MAEKITQIKSLEDKGKPALRGHVNAQSPRGEAPIGIKIISVLYYIEAGLLVLSGIILLIAGIVFVLNPPLTVGYDMMGFDTGVMGAFMDSLGIIFIVLSVVSVLFAVLYFFIARGLKKGNNWTRILLIIFGILGILGVIPLLVMGDSIVIVNGVLSILVTGFIVWYLWFKKSVKEFFG